MNIKQALYEETKRIRESRGLSSGQHEVAMQILRNISTRMGLAMCDTCGKYFKKVSNHKNIHLNFREV